LLYMAVCKDNTPNGDLVRMILDTGGRRDVNKYETCGDEKTDSLYGTHRIFTSPMRDLVRTPLVLALRKNYTNSLVVIEHLLRAGASLSQWSDGKSPLFIAVDTCNEDVVQFLLDHMSVEQILCKQSESGTSLVMRSIMRRENSLAGRLVESGIDCDKGDTETSMTPLFYLLANHSPYSGTRWIIAKLLAHNVNVYFNVTDEAGNRTSIVDLMNKGGMRLQSDIGEGNWSTLQLKLEEQAKERIVAFAQIAQQRLGENSPGNSLPPEIIKMIGVEHTNISDNIAARLVDTMRRL
jgi:hypothetical protein